MLSAIVHPWWKWGVHVSKLSHSCFSIVDMGVLAFPEVFTGFNAGTQLCFPSTLDFRNVLCNGANWPHLCS